MDDSEEQSVVSALTAKYPVVATATIQQWVSQESEKYTAATISAFIPILVQRAVERTLREPARTADVGRQVGVP